jgi:hypothetical protein
MQKEEPCVGAYVPAVHTVQFVDPKSEVKYPTHSNQPFFM